jgi:hypothetical protein
MNVLKCEEGIYTDYLTLPLFQAFLMIPGTMEGGESPNLNIFNVRSIMVQAQKMGRSQDE